MHGSKIIQLPFAGFYDSMWSGEIDHQEESEVEYWPERQAENGVPKAFHVSDSDYAEILFRHTDYSAAYLATARDYVESFNLLLSEALETPLRLTWESMVSPREYNFGTDRVFAYIGRRAIRALWRISAADKHEALAQLSGERFTSRDGFASHYRPDRSDWPADPFEWDHNQLGTLLLAVLRIVYGDERELENRLWNDFAESEAPYQFWSEAVDWPKVEAAVEEKRAEITAQWCEDHGEPAPLPRDPDTPDLFEQHC
jgi:hypothetical protein